MGNYIKYNKGDILNVNSHWVYIKDSDPIIHRCGTRSRTAVFECVCGYRQRIRVQSVKSGKTASCGCVLYGRRDENGRTHGMSKVPGYDAWKAMVQRCYKENHEFFHMYGGRGIKVCDRWLETIDGVKNFLEDMGERPRGGTLDRIDTNGDYEPENCLWRSQSYQCFNQRPRKKKPGGRVGVNRDKNKWVATIKKDRVQYRESYDSFEEAVRAREEMEIRFYGFILDYS